MNPQDMLHLDETRTIVAAVRRIREDASILQEAKADLARTLDRLGLSGNPRAVVAPLLGAALAVVLTAGPEVPQIPNFWG